MKQFLLALAVALPLTFAATAHADNTAGEPAPTLRSNDHLGSNECASAKKAGKACVMNFEDGDNVDGSVATGNGDNVVANSPSKHPSLVELRMNFIDKIVLSADNIL